MKTSRILLACMVLLASSASLADASSEFSVLLDDHWEWQMATSPVMASMLGDRRFNDQWGDGSLKGNEKQNQDTREFLRRVYAIDKNALSADDQLNYELFRRQLQENVDEYEFNAHLMPFSHRGGIQNLENITNQLRLVTVEDYEDWLARVEKIGDLVDQTIALAE